jgi:hypothetical protein
VLGAASAPRASAAVATGSPKLLIGCPLLARR